MTIADLIEAVREVPSQVFADLTLGLPLTLFVILVLVRAGARSGRQTWH